MFYCFCKQRSENCHNSVEKEISIEASNKNDFSINDFLKVVLFVLFDTLVIFFQSSSIQSLKFKNIQHNFFTPIIINYIFLFLIFFISYLFILYFLIFGLKDILNFLNIAPNITLIIVILIFMIRLIPMTLKNCFYICGLMSPDQEYMELFATQQDIESYLGYNNHTKSETRNYMWNLIKNMRSKIYKLIYNESQINFYDIFDPKQKILKRKNPPNKKLIPLIFRNIFVPHGLTILMNTSGVNNYGLRSLIYSILTPARVYFYVYLLMLIIAKIHFIKIF